jgi:hypothetical protein
MLNTDQTLKASSVAIDRRRSEDRRSNWRGGRRDSDWVNRPMGALENLERETRAVSAWHRWFTANS